MKLLFIGLPASGKSTIAKEFAVLNDLCFIDTDVYIEDKYQIKILEIFNKFGEDKFREFENIALKDILQKENIVVATGGGLPCFNNNMEILNKFGTTIYLKASKEIIFSRLTNDKNIRPLIQGKSEQEIILYIENTLKEREPFYKQAHLIIDAEKSIAEQIEIINSQIKTS